MRDKLEDDIRHLGNDNWQEKDQEQRGMETRALSVLEDEDEEYSMRNENEANEKEIPGNEVWIPGGGLLKGTPLSHR